MGGPERKFTLTRKELSAQIEHAYWQGFDFGRDQARDELRDEIRDELQDELESFDPACEMCVMRRELKELERRHSFLHQEYVRLRTRARVAWGKTGRSYPYRGQTVRREEGSTE